MGCIISGLWEAVGKRLPSWWVGNVLYSGSKLVDDYDSIKTGTA